MDSPDAGSSESVESLEKRNKLRRSCELCRASKGRCVPSKDDQNKCQKCLKDRKLCVFLEAKPRPKRSKNSRARVADMEQRLESLYALLSNATKTKEKGAVTPPPAQSPPVAHPEPQPLDFHEFFTNYTVPRIQSEASRFSQQYPMWSFPHLNFDDMQDVMSKGIVSIEQAEESLRLFRTKACHFPFVIVPPQTSLESLRREKPFLLLSILTFGTFKTFALQQTLEQEVREQLSRRVVVNGEKSMELLQGVLLYLCWYQYYFTPERQQVYLLSQMVATMAVDLGINQPTQDSSQTNNFAILAVNSQVFKQRQTTEEMEAKRTFAGCYYLSSAVALGLRKPTSLKYSEYIEECAQVLAQVLDAGTDYLLPHFIALQKFAEDVNHAFDYNAALQQPQLDAMRVEILIKTFEGQLDHLHSTFPPQVWDNLQLSMSYNFLRIYINEVGFHASPPSALDLMAAGSNLRWYCSSARNESLIACLQASKTYLDRFIELSPSQIVDITFPDNIRLVYAVLILGRFSTGCDCPVLGTSSIRKTANMGFYLDRLISKVDDMIILLSKEGEVNHAFFHMRTLWKQSREWFERTEKDPTCTRECPTGQPELNFMDILTIANDKCVDFPWTRGCDDNSYDMLTGWPANLSTLDPMSMSEVMLGET